MNFKRNFLLALGLIILSWLYVFPWDTVGIKLPEYIAKPFTLGLDLQGWVELDYRVDLDALGSTSGATWSEQTIVEWLKSVIDKRVQSLGLTEPNIQSATYGGESHIIVQIPTYDYGNITETEKQKRTKEDTIRAKETIGKVVQLEFREKKTEVTEADKAERKSLADKVLSDVSTTPFATVGAKYRDQYENVFFASGTGSLPPEASFSGVEAITTFPYRSTVVRTVWNPSYTQNENGEIVETWYPGYAIVELQNKIGTGSEYVYSFIFVDERPSIWTPAKTVAGKILNDKYLQMAWVWFNQVGQAQIELLFNDEWKSIFAELTKRLIGKEIAIFVGWQLLTAPTVQAVIPDGRATITGNYTIEEAQKLANNINTGIVPAPIYLTSERSIDAKIGSHALREILNAWLIWLLAIVIFLTFYYRISGLLAWVALIAYTLFLVALVKFSGAVLTLASIAGAILSIGLAIDANILIFERMREAFRSGEVTEKAIKVGFEKSWTAIWDSHITSLTSAIILYIFGISMIKGFGFMLGLGIVLSLFTAMWVSRILIIAVAKTSIGKNTEWFVGLKK
jgi:protein-export membrane protein SecD